MFTVAFGESAMSRTQVQLWFKRFKKGRAGVNDDFRSGRPSTLTIVENIEAVKKLFWTIFESLLHRLLMMLVYRSAHAKRFLKIFSP